jgi:hypothetical protein
MIGLSVHFLRYIVFSYNLQPLLQKPVFLSSGIINITSNSSFTDSTLNSRAFNR